MIESTALVCMLFLLLGIFFAAYRIYQGPKLADRVVAIDLVGVLFLAFSLLYSLYTGKTIYLDVIIVFALIAFLGTVIYARFLEEEFLSRRKRK